jgi:uncharacterized protein YbjQ (UPF0145 family)
MLLTTTETVEGRIVSGYLGIVTGDALAEEAGALGADSVIAIDLDYEVIGGDKSTMLMVSANGTAVKLG